MNDQASRKSYDVIVVGAGMGGLTAAALLAKAGRRILLVEQEEQVGPGSADFCEGLQNELLFAAARHSLHHGL